ncbi:MAG: uracil-DNA glycosylase [archaeon]
MNNKELLKEIEREIESIYLPLKVTSTNLVFGKGNPEAKIVFVGEAAGRNEDLQGLPFVGAAGKNLDKLLASVGLSLDDVYICNILKYRPPENRDPLPKEIEAHAHYLMKQIKVIRPKIVCSLGNYATKFFLAGGNVDDMKNQPGITQVHGKVRDIEMDTQLEGHENLQAGGLKFKLIPLFHPAAIIYNRTKLTPLWEADMEVVKREIGVRENI